MIRQAIGLGAVRSCASQPDPNPSLQTQKLVGIYQRLFPRSRPADIVQSLTKLIDKATTLKIAMTKERAVIRCFMVEFGQSVTENLVDMGDSEGATNVVLLCTLPGLEKLYVDENGRAKTILVRACGEPIVCEESVKDIARHKNNV
jgi:hypothetical protein